MHVYVCSKASRVEVSVQLAPSTISVPQEFNSGYPGRKHLYLGTILPGFPILKIKNKPL